jgi:hypothetical protein
VDNAVAASSAPAAMTIDFMGSSPLRSPGFNSRCSGIIAFSRTAHRPPMANNAIELA